MEQYRVVIYMGLQYSIVSVTAVCEDDAVRAARAEYPGGMEYTVELENTDKNEFSGPVPAAVYHGDF